MKPHLDPLGFREIKYTRQCLKDLNLDLVTRLIIEILNQEISYDTFINPMLIKYMLILNFVYQLICLYFYTVIFRFQKRWFLLQSFYHPFLRKNRFITLECILYCFGVLVYLFLQYIFLLLQVCNLFTILLCKRFLPQHILFVYSLEVGQTLCELLYLPVFFLPLLLYVLIFRLFIHHLLILFL